MYTNIARAWTKRILLTCILSIVILTTALFFFEHIHYEYYLKGNHFISPVFNELFWLLVDNK